MPSSDHDTEKGAKAPDSLPASEVGEMSPAGWLLMWKDRDGVEHTDFSLTKEEAEHTDRQLARYMTRYDGPGVIRPVYTADFLARVAMERREYADSAAYWKIAHDRVVAERDENHIALTQEATLSGQLQADLEAAEAALEKAREALAEASDGLRYWEPQTDKGWRERARITSLVDAALAAMEACDE